MTTTTPMPALYVPHGAGPCFFMDWDPPDTWDRMRAFLASVLNDLPARPKAIVAISAHWEAPRFTVATARHPALLFDYNGFPPHTYALRYDAPGDPSLAARIRGLLADAGLPDAADERRGFDHGIFVPLMVMAPAAEIPVVALSLRAGLDPAEHAALGHALRPLRDDGVLLLGSGMSYHNMRGYGRSESGPVSERFDVWLTDTVADPDPASRATRLAEWAAHADGRASHPREEHLLPLMVVAASGDATPGRRIFSDHVLGTTVSAFRFD